MVKKIGIECHNLEGERFGVGQTLIQLLESLSKIPNIEKKFEFYLYFKKEVPKDDILNFPIFRKKILRIPHLPPSFSIFYHILLPVYYFLDKLDGFFFPGYMLPAFFIGKSAVIMTNDVAYEVQKGTLPLKYRLAYGIFSNLAILRATKIITISETARKEIIKTYNLPEKRIDSVPWGINGKLSNISFSQGELDAVRKKYSINRNFIFSWGQAFPRRHIKEAMLAFSEIANDLPDFQYFVACADKYNPPIIENLAKKINSDLGRNAIIYKKYISDQNDLFALIKSAHLVVYVSDSEAMGLPPIEALALGIPSLVADNDLTHEIFNKNAFFVAKTDNVKNMATEMKNGIFDISKRRQIIANGDIVARKYSWSSCANKLLSIFNYIF